MFRVVQIKIDNQKIRQKNIITFGNISVCFKSNDRNTKETQKIGKKIIPSKIDEQSDAFRKIKKKD